MAGLSTLPQITTGIGALSGLLLVTPNANKGYQPQNNIVAAPPLPTPISNNVGTLPQSPSFLFNYEGEQTVTLESDITDHYVEDNTAIQDQISLKPEIITTHGFIGELNDVAPASLALLQMAANKLGALSAYLPVLSVTALNAYNEAFFLYQTAASAQNSVVSAISSLNGGVSQNKQQTAFTTFYGYWQQRYLFTVQTPWAIFPNMAIRTLRAIQDAETRVITNFEITFKRMRFAKSTSQVQSSTTGDFGSSRAAAQAAGLTDLGTSSPPLSPTTLTQGIAGVTA